MKKYKKIIIILTLISAILFISPNHISASSFFNSIDVNSLNLNSIEKSKIEGLKNTIGNIKEKDYTSAGALENIDKNEIKNGNINSVNVNEINIDEVIGVYEDLSKVISNEDIAKFIDDNKETLTKAGADENLLQTSSTLLKTFDADTVIDIVQNDLDINELLDIYKNGGSIDDILKSVMQSTSTTDKIKIITKLLFSNGYFKLIFALIIVVAIYSIFITSYIFKKAGKPGYATVIPIYRDIIHLKICNFSPWLLLLIFVPIIGWLALASIAILRKIWTF